MAVVNLVTVAEREFMKELILDPAELVSMSLSELLKYQSWIERWDWQDLAIMQPDVVLAYKKAATLLSERMEVVRSR